MRPEQGAGQLRHVRLVREGLQRADGGADAPGPGRARLREVGGAPRNLAPRNHFSVWIVKPSGCHCTDGHLTSRVFTEDQANIVECRPPLGARPLSPSTFVSCLFDSRLQRAAQAFSCSSTSSGNLSMAFARLSVGVRTSALSFLLLPTAPASSPPSGERKWEACENH